MLWMDLILMNLERKNCQKNEMFRIEEEHL
jgi:hypothetical protein